MKEIDVDSAQPFSSLVSGPSRRCLMRRHSRRWWYLIVAYLILCLPIVVLCLADVRASRRSDFGNSINGKQSFESCYEPGDGCSCFDSFCFQSTLVDFIDKEDDSPAPPDEVSDGFHQASKSVSFTMFDGEIVSCSLRNSESGIPFLKGSGNSCVDAEGVNFLEDSLVPDLLLNAFSSLSSDPDEHFEEVEEAGVLISSSSLPEIDISPPMLDWGTKNIYSPSLEILQLVNKHNERVLNVYDLFSTNSQFKAYNFQKLSLSPGESASIPLIFLPIWLGLSSAQLVLQTSFGGFVIRVKGIATMSPYHLQPFAGFNISNGKKFNGKLPLYNPSNDVLYVKEVTAWIAVSDSKKKHSAHVFCSANRFQQNGIQSVPHTDSEWFSLRSGELGSSRIDIRPHQHWEVPPNSSSTIIELNFWPHFGRKVSGGIWLKFGISSQENSETVVLPIDIDVHERESYTDLSGSVSLYFDTLIPCHGRKTVFSISLKNDASYLLHVVKISEETEACKVFEIRYMEGLLLFPGTVTQIAVITYSHPHNSQGRVAENHSSVLNCMLMIRTNDSTNPEISIPCHDFVLSSCKYQHGFHSFEQESSYINLVSKHQDEKHSSIISLGNANEEPSQFKLKISEVIESGDLVLNNWKSQGTMSMMSVLEDQELLFPVVRIGSHYSKWINVYNPSSKPVVMQLVLNSGAIIDHCQFSDELSEHTLLTKFSHFDSAEIRVGFSIAESAVTEAFVPPLGSALFGPVIFHPSNRCMWRSSALIRNNLSGVEWLPLQAFGGSQSLVILESSVPILKLDFDLHVLMTFNVSASDAPVLIENSVSYCNNLFYKELSAKNTGELPLEVLKLKISGFDCGSDGFTIHNCKGFTLAPGESISLLISYQSDFSAAVVRRDLELAMDTGILVIPMKAAIPACMLNMCRKAFFRSMYCKLFLLVLFTSAIILHFIFRIITWFFSPPNGDYFSKFNNAEGSGDAGTSSSVQITRNSRFSRNDKRFDSVNYFSRFSNCTTNHHETARKNVVKGCSDHQKNGSHSPQLGNNRIDAANNSQTLEMPQNCNLTIRIVRDKVRRRKRRPTAAGLATKLDVSSSQSGNSTPSSPLSPIVSTPKHTVVQSHESSVHIFAEGFKEHSNSKEHRLEVSNSVRKAESAKCSSDNKWPLSNQGLPSENTKNFLGKPALLTSATFPGPGWRAPGINVSSFLASTSPISPCSRAPGSKVCSKEKMLEGDENDSIPPYFTYDIWGNHFSEHIFCGPKERTSKMSDASEGDSHSFFTRDPQSSPMMMSLARSVSPVLTFSP